MKKWTRQWFGERVYISKNRRFLPVFARYLCEIFIRHKNVCPQSERAWKMLLFLFFLHKSLAQKLWKIWSMIGLGRVSRHWRHMTLFRLAFPKRYSYNTQQKRVNIFAFIDCNYRVGCSCNVSEMWAETVSCAFSEALWRHATPVRDLLLTISSIVFELETCVKKKVAFFTPFHFVDKHF